MFPAKFLRLAQEIEQENHQYEPFIPRGVMSWEELSSAYDRAKYIILQGAINNIEYKLACQTMKLIEHAVCNAYSIEKEKGNV